MTLADLKRAERYAYVVRDTTKAMYEAAQRALDDLEHAISKAEREEENRVPWEEAPEWAMWVAMDSDNEWWWYESEPCLDGLEWIPKIGTVDTLHHKACSDWKTSKQRRPQ